MARSRGLEPLTYGLEGRCSIQLSYERSNACVSGYNRPKVSNRGYKPQQIQRLRTAKCSKIPKTTAKMVRPVGIEPTAYRSEVCRSIQLSYERVISINLRFKVLFFKHFRKHIFGKCPKQRAIKPLSNKHKNSLKAKLYHFRLKILLNKDKFFYFYFFLLF